MERIKLAGRVPKSDPPRAYHRDLIEVQIEPDAVAGMPPSGRARGLAVDADVLPHAMHAPFGRLRTSRLIREVTPVFATSTRPAEFASGPAMFARAFTASVREIASNELAGFVMLRLSPKADLEAVRKDLEAAPGVRSAHLVPARWLAAADPFQNRQWGLRATRWFEAAPLVDASGVGVAVLDTGVDEKHPDLRVNRYVHPGTSAVDIIGHGTHVAGIICAKTNNAIGITGISNCQLNVYKIFPDEPSSDGEFYVEPITYRRALNAVRTSGDRVVNLSIGGTARDSTEEMLFKRVHDAGVITVAAMGNDFELGNPTEYPAAFKDVIAVGATNEANQRAPFSNTGRNITIAAPGQNILSTLPTTRSSERPTKDDTNYASWSGTSMATPHVTAALALLLAAHPDLDARGALAKLTSTATHLPKMRSARTTSEFGAGLLNIRDLVS